MSKCKENDHRPFREPAPEQGSYISMSSIALPSSDLDFTPAEYLCDESARSPDRRMCTVGKHWFGIGDRKLTCGRSAVCYMRRHPQGQD